MQVLKEDVRENIVGAALREFGEKGYRDSSMRVIAQNSGIVMGNIYRYFENKEALFDAVVGAVYGWIEGVSANVQAEIEAVRGPWSDEQAQELIERLYGKILETFSGHGKELLILLDKSAGSAYENTKRDLIEQTRNILEARLSQEVKMEDPFVCFVVASAFVEGICVVLRDAGGHDKEAVIGTFSNIVLCQISKRM